MTNHPIQGYMRLAASRGRETERVGPFTATFSRHSDNPFLNYAVPDEGAQPSPQDVAALIFAYQKRGRKPRLEYLPFSSPAVEAALIGAGFCVEGRLPLMIYAPETPSDDLAPAGIEVVVASSPEELRGVLVVQFEAYDETSSPDADDVKRLQNSIEHGGIAVLARDAATGEPAGAGVCAPPFLGITELAAIGVRSAFRRRGIAGAVTARLAYEAKFAGTTTIFLTPAHEEGERIYHRVGFRAVSEMLHISKA